MATRRSSTFGLTREEALGLAVAVGAHVALIAVLTLAPLGRRIEPPPQRMTVSLADTIADQSTSPKPDAQAAPDVAQDLGEPEAADLPQPLAAPPAPPPPPFVAPKPKAEPKPASKPEPKPKLEPKPKPAPKPEPKSEPKPKPEPKPKLEPKAEAKPKPKVERKPKVEPKREKTESDDDDTPKTQTKSKTQSKSDAKPKTEARTAPDAKPAGGDTRSHPHDKPVGGSKIGSDFLKGIPGDTSPGTDKVSPADKPAAVSAADIRSAISRQIKPHWTAPQGADAEKLVTVIAFSLNPDGSLAGPPELYSQSGITDANRPQAQRHAELAIRAVKLAAPFSLPSQVYRQFHKFQSRFDYKLSQ